MKKILLVAVVFAFATSAFAGTTTTTNPTTNPTTTVAATTPTKAPATPVTEPTLKGNITKMDATTVCVKDNANKEWTFKFGTVNVKEYKIGDAVEVKYEKDNLKSIAKVTKK